MACDHIWEEPGPNGYMECRLCRVGRLLEPGEQVEKMEENSLEQDVSESSTI